MEFNGILRIGRERTDAVGRTEVISISGSVREPMAVHATNSHALMQSRPDSQLRILQWARANGCPWEAEECFNLTAEFGHTDIVEWINGNCGL
jgi:hypothetical protein